MVCRQRSPGGGEINVELPQLEGEDDDEAAAGRAGRSFPSRLQDSRSMDGLSGACGGGGSSSSGKAGAGGGRRATISSPLELEGMYTLLACSEELERALQPVQGLELERALQPVQGLARQVRDIRRTLEVLEALCK